MAVSYITAERMNSDVARARTGAEVSPLQNIARGAGGDTKLIQSADVPTLPRPLCLPKKFGRKFACDLKKAESIHFNSFR